ncbi:hypothetical protein EDC30_102110 [Paucimonas lemoignei]|uniref:Uncharacterized protein n=1 Tax=Paucimonas lemoignei TaxID=29443 RepID=A0A4R3I079_PAULE|nr:hypothetical protein [Paucimonas lemoignei]TCS38373.1 hypothetical protein EDC30_102110 [Paucimonas lemoignei]
MYYQEQDETPVYRVASVAYERRRVDPPITINGKEVSRYPSPVVTEYVDMRTGEVIPAKTLRNNPEVWPVVYLSENALRRQAVLNTLREEVRHFALFVLSFRNHRRGVTPGMDKLVVWYARLNEQRPANVRRNVKTLEKTGILAGSSLLGPLFQFSGRHTKAREHLGEDGAASAKYLVMSLKKQAKGFQHSPLSQPVQKVSRSQMSVSPQHRKTLMSGNSRYFHHVQSFLKKTRGCLMPQVMQA